MYCPACQKAAHMRKIQQGADGNREIIYQCRNVECSTTFVTKEILSHIVENSTMTLKNCKSYYRG